MSCLLSLARRPHDIPVDDYSPIDTLSSCALPSDSAAEPNDVDSVDSDMQEWLAEAAEDTSDDSDSTVSGGQLTPSSPEQAPQLMAPDPPALPSIAPPQLPSQGPPSGLAPWRLPPSRTIAATHLVHAITGLRRLDRLAGLVAWGGGHSVELPPAGAAACGEKQVGIVFESLRLAAVHLQRWTHVVQSEAARVAALQPPPAHAAPRGADLEGLLTAAQAMQAPTLAAYGHCYSTFQHAVLKAPQLLHCGQRGCEGGLPESTRPCEVVRHCCGDWRASHPHAAPSCCSPCEA